MIRLKIITPDDGLMLDEDVLYVDVLTLDGHIGLQKDIIPMVAKLKQGPITITRLDKTKRTGILLDAVLYNDHQIGIKIMASKFVWEDELNIDNIKEQLLEIEQQIKRLNPNDKRMLQLEDEMITLKNFIQAINNFPTKS